jgi:hypothetical protein
MFRSIKHHALVGTRGPSGRWAADGAEGLPSAAVSAAGHRSMEGKGGCCCDIDIVRDLRTGDGDTGVLERKEGVADREAEEMPGVEIRPGTVDADRDGEVGATDAERVGGVWATDDERLSPRRESGEAILGM